MAFRKNQNRTLWIIFLVSLIIALLPWVLLAQGMEKQKFHVKKDGEDQIGYAQAVKVGHAIYISGSRNWRNF